MCKLKILILQIIGCLVCGIVIGMAFWLCDGGKTCKKVSDCKVIKVYRGQWFEDIQQVGEWWSVGYIQREVIQ